MSIGLLRIDNETGIRLDTDIDTIPDNTLLIVSKLTNGQAYDITQIILKDSTSNVHVYDISLEVEGMKIQPNGKVKISIPIPNDLDTSKLVVCRITDTGEKIEYTATIETIDGIKYATFETDHFSTYVLGEKTATSESNKDNEQKETSSKEDNTKAPGNLPQAGVGISLTIATIAVIVISLLAYIKYKNLKDI